MARAARGVAEELGRQPYHGVPDERVAPPFAGTIGKRFSLTSLRAEPIHSQTPSPRSTERT